MKSIGTKFLISVCAILISICAILVPLGLSIGTGGQAFAAANTPTPAPTPISCTWTLLQDVFVAPQLGTHVAESQMYRSTCSGAAYCRLIDHSSTVDLYGALYIFGSANTASTGVDVPPRGYRNGLQLNGSVWYYCGGVIAATSAGTSYSFTTAQVSVGTILV